MECDNPDNDCIDRNFLNMNHALKSPIERARHSILREFVGTEPNSVSVGCGGYEPVVIGTQNAVDVNLRAEHYLRSVGFSGPFFQADVRKIPVSDKFYKIAVCSEVIEHLSTFEDVRAAILEVNRISERWIFTTPCKACFDPDHKFLFSESDLKNLFAGLNFQIFIYGYFFYISNDGQRLNSIILRKP